MYNFKPENIKVQLIKRLIDQECLVYDYDRVKWTQDLQLLKEFVEKVIGLTGYWKSPGGKSKQFRSFNLDFITTWYPGKQNSLTFNGTDGVKCKEFLVSVLSTYCVDDHIIGIDKQLATSQNPAPCMSDANKNLQEIGVQVNEFGVNNMNNSQEILERSAAFICNPVSGTTLPTEVYCKAKSEMCLKSLCNHQCDCSCSLLAAELEGIKLEMVITQKNIMSNTNIVNAKLEEKIKCLEHDLAKEKGKCRQLEIDLTVLVNGRNVETADLNNIIVSLENKLLASEALNQSLRLEITQLNKQSQIEVVNLNSMSRNEEHANANFSMCDVVSQHIKTTSDPVADDPKANESSCIGQLSSSLDPNSLNQEEKNDIHTVSNDLLGESTRDMPPKCMQKEQCIVNKGDSSSYSCKITNTMPRTTLRAGNKNQLSPRVNLRKSVKSGLNYLPLITMIPKSDEVDPNDVNRRVSIDEIAQ